MTIYSLDKLLSQFGTSLLYYPVLTVSFWPAYRFFRRKVRWSGIPISIRIFQFVVIHIVNGFGIVSNAEITTDWFQIGKGVHQGCILSPCLFNFYAEYIMRNAGLEEAQAGIKIAGRNINNLRYPDDTTLMAETEEELKGLLMKVKGE